MGMDELGPSPEIGLSTVYRSVLVQRSHKTAPPFTISVFTRVQLSDVVRGDLQLDKSELDFDVVGAGRKGVKSWAAVIVVRKGSYYGDELHTLRVELSGVVSSTASAGLNPADMNMLRSPANLGVSKKKPEAQKPKPKMLAELSSSPGFADAAANGASSAERKSRRKAAASAERFQPEPVIGKRKATPSKSHSRKQARTTANSIAHEDDENAEPADDSEESANASPQSARKASRAQSGRVAMQDITNTPEFRQALESELSKRAALVNR